MKVISTWFGFMSGMLIWGIWCGLANGQVIPDSTLKTTVSQNGNSFTITNGTRVGNNLFHSFSQFSIPTKSSAFFNNASDIQNIFSRVTGGNVSNIDGLIQANGNANLFLLNPNGIIFGSNASLNIGGSFIATTAEEIKFSDGAQFSAVNPQTDPLLSINVPIGLQMGYQPPSIQVEGTGHALNTSSNPALFIRTPSQTKLQVKPGKTLALVGGNLSLNGATLTAEKGRIELGSLGGEGFVSLVPITQGYKLEYGSGQSFGNIQLAQKSLLDVSGVDAGSVQLRGRNIKFTDGSLVLSTNLGNLPSGSIDLQASEAIDMIGMVPDNAKIASGVHTEALSKGTGADINIITPILTLQQGAELNSFTFGVADSGKSQIQASAIEISGFSPLNPIGLSSLITATLGTGNAGDIVVNSDNLLMLNGGTLSSVTFGNGSSGQVNIHSSNITVRGDSPIGLFSNISVLTLGTGSAKALTLDTGKLQLLDGGEIAGASLFMGNTGDIKVNATESIEISGRSQFSQSSISSSVIKLEPEIAKLLGIPNILTANAGNVNITTPNLILTNGARVSVTNQGTGNGGNLSIVANNIQLKNQALIEAQTQSGNGGDINLEVGNLLLMRNNSQITATSGVLGNGGNISINSPNVVGLGNSDIVANAALGSGGNIRIATQDILGLKYSPQLTPESDITASSKFGVSGTVQVNNVGVDPNSGLVQLPQNIIDSSQKIATGCSSNNGSSFVATGRGGIPQNPNQQLMSDRTWTDVRNLSQYEKNSQVTAKIPEVPEVLIQATGWHLNTQGEIELVANKSLTQVQPPLTCAAVPKT